MTIDDILAKPDQTLIEHTNDCLDWLGFVFKWKGRLIDLMCERYKLDKNLVINRLFLTIAFHDIGKANHAFQNKIKKNGKREQESHPLASVPFILYHTEHNPIVQDDDNGFLPETLAIVSHHNKLYPGVYSGFKEFSPKWVSEPYFIQFYEFLNKKAGEMQIPGWKPLAFDPAILKKNPYYNFYDYAYCQAENLVYLKTKIRDIFLLFKAVLHNADWLASGRETHFDYSTPIKMNSIEDNFRSHLQKNNIEFSWRAFQTKASISPGHIFVQIPTGQGKTEASLLWAVNQNNSQKIIYLLPTQVTTNKIHKRLRDFFQKEENIGLSHGSSQFVIKEEYEYEEDWLFRKNRLLNRTFFKAVTVATVDQLIYSFFNWGHWVLTSAASFNARIIIDEIHLYDGYTFGLILKTIECIVPYNSQFAIMSASLPNIMRAEVEKLLPQGSWADILEPEYNEKQRHNLKTIDCEIDALLPQIMDDYERHSKKVLIICNTIKRAQEIYNQIEQKVPSGKKMLYHSQFTLLDKIWKEDLLDRIKDIDGGFVAICTQIVEVSLDIDFDVLYTENAPIDAIIQRLGRVNRKGYKGIDAPVYICRESEVARKWVYKGLDHILDLTFDYLSAYIDRLDGNLKEKHFKEIVDLVYTHENLSKTTFYSDIEDARKLITALWEKTVHNFMTISASEAKLNDVSSRKKGLVTVDCIMEIHNQEHNLLSAIKNGDYELIRKYTIKVALHIVKNKKALAVPDSNIYLLPLKYDSERGIYFDKIEDMCQF